MADKIESLAAIEDAIALALEDPDCEFSEEEKLQIIDELASMEAGKVDRIYLAMRKGRARIDTCRQIARDFDRKARAGEARYDWLRQYLLETMKAHGIEKVRGNVATMAVRKTQSVFVGNPEALHKEYPELVKVETTYKPDKEEIKRLLGEGVNLPDCSLQQNEYVVVR